MCKTLPRSSLGAANILYIILSDMTIIAEFNAPVTLFALIALNPESLTAFPPLYSTAYCSFCDLQRLFEIVLLHCIRLCGFVHRLPYLSVNLQTQKKHLRVSIGRREKRAVIYLSVWIFPKLLVCWQNNAF